MEKLHRDAVFVHDDAERALAYGGVGHVHKGIALLLRYLRNLRHALKVEPEYALAQTYADGRKAPERDVKRGAQDIPVHRLTERGGKAENVAPLLAKRGGVYLGRIVEAHPLLLSFRCHDTRKKLIYRVKV